MSRPRVLLVEDDDTLRMALQYRLEQEGMEIVPASSGTDALAAAAKEPMDLVLLDLMLPGVHGLEVCRLLRSRSAVPIIILSAKAEELDRIIGLEIGADDYVTKPFGMTELIARVRAHLRRNAPTPQESSGRTIVDGDLTLDLERHEVRRGERAVNLKPQEYKLLAFLMQHRGQAFTRTQLLDRVWNYEALGGGRTVDVHIAELRRKIEDAPSAPRRLVTVRSVGYRFG